MSDATAFPRSCESILANEPAMIESVFPVSRLSMESYKEREAKQNQTLTSLGSYWKGRKPLILVRATILGSLLPAKGEDAEGRRRDLDMFLKLMAMDDASLGYRRDGNIDAGTAHALFTKEERNRYLETSAKGKPAWRRSAPADLVYGYLTGSERADAFEVDADSKPTWLDGLAADVSTSLERTACRRLKEEGDALAFERMSYEQKIRECLRPEELEEQVMPVAWDEINAYYGTRAGSLQQFVAQVGAMRFGRNPRVSDRFSGGGSIPFEAARLGCDVLAADLNPVAGMLTWGAFNVIGGTDEFRADLAEAQRAVAAAVDRQLTDLRIEHDEAGNRAKAYLYCLETRCDKTGWLIPMATTWIVHKWKKVVVELVPNKVAKRFDFRVVMDATDDQMAAATAGTVVGSGASVDLVYTVEGVQYRRSIKSIRGDRRIEGKTINDLRLWTRDDFVPQPDDVFQERLCCIRWIERGTGDDLYTAPTEADIEREETVVRLVADNLARWQAEGIVPDMEIMAGEETDRLFRERGWTHWHHLFNPRQLLFLALYKEAIGTQKDEDIAAGLLLVFNKMLDHCSRICHWHPGRAKPEQVFYNQAFNTFYNYGCRAFAYFEDMLFQDFARSSHLEGQKIIEVTPASAVQSEFDLFITDPPYADAIHYHEVTEYFIAWNRKYPPAPFAGWTWDSRRPLAIKGKGVEFRRRMIEAYQSMAQHMPDNGMQVVMFTHTEPGVWADLAMILWAAGLRVTAAWCIATETETATRDGNHVQGTVLLVLRKRNVQNNAWADEVLAEVEDEVVTQIKMMLDLEGGHGTHGIRNFTDADYQLAAYAAALRVVTSYATIDKKDVGGEVLRERKKGEKTEIQKLIEHAVEIANNYLVPEGISEDLWRQLEREARFYLKMVEVEARGNHAVSAYSEFARGFGVTDYRRLMASDTANKARLKSASDFKGRDLGETEFGRSLVRHVLFGIWKTVQTDETKDAITYLRTEIPDYWKKRQALAEIARYIGERKTADRETECVAAVLLAGALTVDRM